MDARLRAALEKHSVKDAAAIVSAETGLPRRKVYARALELGGGREGDWVHAYLHRREGDAMNAGYWYARARRPAATGDLAAEWEEIARELVKGFRL